MEPTTAGSDASQRVESGKATHSAATTQDTKEPGSQDQPGTVAPIPPDPCGLSECGRKGCCHNPSAQELTATNTQDFLAMCIPPGEMAASLDARCPDFAHCTKGYTCDFKGCRRADGRCGIVVDTFELPEVDGLGHRENPNLGCIDECWLVSRNPTGIPPDPTLECYTDLLAWEENNRSADAPDAD